MCLRRLLVNVWTAILTPPLASDYGHLLRLEEDREVFEPDELWHVEPDELFDNAHFVWGADVPPPRVPPDATRRRPHR
jgi:hypothetical protein